MSQTWRHIEVEQRGDVSCVRLKRYRIEEPDMPDMASELITLGSTPGCRKVALSLGPQPPECLYSVFLAKLMSVQRRLAEHGCTLVICEAGTEIHALFRVCKFAEHFQFLPDFDAAVSEVAAN